MTHSYILYYLGFTDNQASSRKWSETESHGSPGALLSGANPDISLHSRPAKVSCVSLPVEYELMKLVQRVVDRPTTWNLETPGCKWVGVDCDFKGNVIRINYPARHIRNELDIRFLPQTLRHFNLSANKLSGRFSFVSLPSTLTYLAINHNEFSGATNFLLLPLLLTHLDIAHNKFEGEVDFSALPPPLVRIFLNDNVKLEGTVDVQCSLKGMYYNIENTKIIALNGRSRRLLYENSFFLS